MQRSAPFGKRSASEVWYGKFSWLFDESLLNQFAVMIVSQIRDQRRLAMADVSETCVIHPEGRVAVLCPRFASPSTTTGNQLTTIVNTQLDTSTKVLS